MQTKTYEDWSKYIGQNPHRLGVVARMYTDNTLTFITDGLRNVYYKDKNADKFQISNSLCFEWLIESNQIKHIEFAEVPEGNGANGTEITMAFRENHFQKYDIFRIDATKQQCEVLSNPIRKHDGRWEVQVRLIANNYDTVLDFAGCNPGDTAMWLSVAVGELSKDSLWTLAA